MKKLLTISFFFPIIAFGQRIDMKGDRSFTFKIKGYTANDSFTVVKDSDDLKVLTSKGVLVKAVFNGETIPLHFVDLDPTGWQEPFGFIYTVEDNGKYDINIYRGKHHIRILKFKKVIFQR